MTSDNSQWRLTRRQALIGSAAAAGSFTGLAEAMNSKNGNLYGGTMALDKAYNVSEGLYIGPDSAKSNVSPDSGQYYLASDTEREYYGDGNSWQWKGAEYSNLTGEYDRLITSTAGLEGLGSNLSDGEVICVAQPDMPYRTSSWIDVDNSNVTIKFESKWAKNGEPILKIADGANVGGIRVGVSTMVRNVTIQGYGHHGNDLNQDQSVKDLDGIVLKQCSDVEIVDGFFTRTSPYHEHDTGGDAIRVTSNTSDYRIRNIRSDHIGDQTLRLIGDGGVIQNIVGTNGFDRVVNCPGSHIEVSNVFARDIESGSVIGGSGNHNTLKNVVARGQHFRIVHLTTGAQRNVISNLNGRQETSPSVLRSGITFDSGTSDNTVTGFTLRQYNDHGIENLGADNNRFQNGIIQGPSNDGIHSNGKGGHTYNSVFVENYGGVGINAQDSDNTFAVCRVLKDTAGTILSETGSGNTFVACTTDSGTWAISGAGTTFHGAGTEDLGVSPTNAPTGSWPEGAVVRNSNADNNETWQLVGGTWVQIA